MTPERRRRLRARLLLPLLVLAIFSLGIALGDALDDNPTPGGTQTIVRTLKVLELAPAPAKTVTVTTTTP
jgi:hypothetical protein